MSKLELKKCDACGLVQGEDGRAEWEWASVRVPEGSGIPAFARSVFNCKDYCLNCWSEIKKSIPRLPERPAAPSGRKAE